MFMRDVKQAEVLLSQQDNVLSKEEVPVSVSLHLTFHFLYLDVSHCSVETQE